MATVTVYRYRRYNIATDDYVRSTRMATLEQIERIGAEVIPGTEAKVDAKLIVDGWTEKDFDPTRKPQTPEEIARERAAAEPTIYPDS